MEKKKRAYELDLLRGIAMIMMLFMHFSWDVRYEFGINTLSYLESRWFNAWVHPIILVLFIGVAGICCTFSRNNIKRGLKVLGVGLGFTIATYIATNYMGIDCLILFNVLHLLGLAGIIYGVVVLIEKKMNANPMAVSMILGLVGAYVLATGSQMYYMAGATNSLWFLPIGFYIKGLPSMADYLPIFPWMGIFFVGSAVGRICYAGKETLFPNRSNWLKKIEAPIEFFGRHSLLIYITHQPVMYGLLYLFFKLAGKI